MLQQSASNSAMQDQSACPFVHQLLPVSLAHIPSETTQEFLEEGATILATSFEVILRVSKKFACHVVSSSRNAFVLVFV